ncbi:aminoglycoside adenylyltransferase [Bhargavaea cecembensis]|uniref:Aminoglycoside N(6')-acetyltransferase type 1 n=1 Tax=Bhargavaea cecembensis TaxID=394098 RepID=A0A163EXK7_9BACL|nr:aminoglycoside 6'-N-acetyltransferase [Bhargavaea cecembensis]KZE37436.1 aminoglycoside adenylyltransferase [Bhargavaea cecembensis]
MNIRQATQNDARFSGELALLLWPDHTVEELEREFSELIGDPEAAVFLAFDGKEPVGFSQVQLRQDYVEGTSTSPVGYLEGLYVKETYRQDGLARELVRRAEQWAQDQGCMEFASDCELNNDVSLQVHLALGFTEANRIICFTKRIGETR